MCISNQPFHFCPFHRAKVENLNQCIVVVRTDNREEQLHTHKSHTCIIPLIPSPHPIERSNNKAICIAVCIATGHSGLYSCCICMSSCQHWWTEMGGPSESRSQICLGCAWLGATHVRMCTLTQMQGHKKYTDTPYTHALGGIHCFQPEHYVNERMFSKLFWMKHTEA